MGWKHRKNRNERWRSYGTISRNKAFANEFLKSEQLSHLKGVAYNLVEKADSMDNASFLLTMNLLVACELEDVLKPMPKRSLLSQYNWVAGWVEVSNRDTRETAEGSWFYLNNIR